MGYKTISFVRENQLGVLTIQRPEALNALNMEVIAELEDLFGELGNNVVGALIVTGAGEKAFVAGADIKQMESMTAPQAKEFAHRGQSLFRRLEEFPFVTIAAVNGFALGGGLELALSCDWMVASKNAKWGLPEVSLGLIPGYGGTQRLSRVAGKAIAKRVALTGEIFTADQGLAWGLFTAVVDGPELMGLARKQAELVMTRAPLAVGYAKRAIEIGFDLPIEDGFKEEARLFGQSFQTKDHNEGIQAFITKRAPKFTGE